MKHCTIFFPTTEQFSLHMPTTTLTDQRHGDQFAVRTDRRRSWSFEERRNLFPYVIDYHEYPSAKIFKFSYPVLVLCVV